MRICYWLLLLYGLGSLLSCRQPVRKAPVVRGQSFTSPVPPVLRRLLTPLRSLEGRADVATMQAARPQWDRDSLGRLLGHSRLANDFSHLNQFDSSARHMRQAWRMVSPTLCRQQPGEVVYLANALGVHYYQRADYDSARTYFQAGARLFRAAGLDSGYVQPEPRLPNGMPWAGGLVLASCVANIGLASRHLGELDKAVRYYERATVLYQHNQWYSGLIWSQCLTGEAYAEQHDYLRARAAYDQALHTARQVPRSPAAGNEMADVVLDYYEPLLLAQPRLPAYARQLARETMADLKQYYPMQQALDTANYGIRAAQFLAILAEVALRDGQPAAATAPLAAANKWLAVVKEPFRSWPTYPAAQATSWGLRAWQQHATHPAVARHLLDQATALLGSGSIMPWQVYRRRQLAGYCLAMHEPAYALRLLRPLVPLYQRPLSVLPLSQVTGLLSQAYAGVGRYDSAYYYAGRTQVLTDSLRAGHQFAALAAAETRYRTREQASQIQLLMERSQQQAQRLAVAAGGVAVFALALLAVGLAWRATRRLNQQLASQKTQLEDQKTQLETQTQRLGELDTAKNQFFANVSHELRTPLTLVLGPLQQALAPQPAGVRRELLATSLRHAQHLRSLIDRILDLTKLEAGKLPVHLRPTLLAPLLTELIEQFTPLATAGGLVLHRPANVPETLALLLDAEKVSQILTNLLANAVQHTPAGGHVQLLFAQPGPDCYALTVQDTGPGIAETEQGRLFERFYQSPQRQARGGTGLGLALSRELAHVLGGHLALASQLGQGAAFTFTFSAQPASAPATASPEASLAPLVSLPALAAQPSRARLLLVEDHAEMRAYLRSLLAPHYEVLEAEDGQQALAVLAREAVDLVASDAMMPRLSGLDLLHALKADPNWQGIPFLMVTARADEAHRLAALTVGVDDYLTKPFEATELLARVRTLLANYQARLHYATLVSAEAAGPAGETAFAANLPEEAPELAAADQLAQWQAQVADYLPNIAFGPDELAAQLFMSRRTLYRRLGELAGLTPAAWLRELRLHKARQLLETGGFGSVAQVAEATGFATPKYFSTLYTERFGRRPSDYSK